MKVGGLEETITVTGETPVVDVQNARNARPSSSHDVIEALPVTRAAGAHAQHHARASRSPSRPAAPLADDDRLQCPVEHDQLGRRWPAKAAMTINGFPVTAARSGGFASIVYDTVNVDEVNITVGGGLGESDIGGPVMNIIPRSGGNKFAGSAFLNTAGEWSSGDNLDAETQGEEPGPAADGGRHQRVRLERVLRRPDQEGSPVVLRQLPQPRHALRRGRHHRQRQRRRCRALGLGRLADRGAPRQGPQMFIGRLTGQFGKNRFASTPNTSIAAKARR